MKELDKRPTDNDPQVTYFFRGENARESDFNDQPRWWRSRTYSVWRATGKPSKIVRTESQRAVGRCATVYDVRKEIPESGDIGGNASGPIVENE
jgi:hypothetical protein